MATGDDKSEDFYAVLGLGKACSEAELRIAYKKLAMRWHPDKCSTSANPERMEEAKQKFQEIQKAYSVLSDSNKRFLYDVGVYDNDDDNDEKGMGDFLGEMAQMMSQSKPCENDRDTFEELQQMFIDIFQDDVGTGFGGPWPWPTSDLHCSSSSGLQFANGGTKGSDKRDNTAMNSGKLNLDELERCATGFCFGTVVAAEELTDPRVLNDGQSSKGKGSSTSGKRRNGRKQKVSAKDEVSI